MSKLVVGIDPGMSGAIAILEVPLYNVLFLQDLPVVEVGGKRELELVEIRDWLEHDLDAVTHVFIEKAQAMPILEKPKKGKKGKKEKPKKGKKGKKEKPKPQGVVSTGRYMKSFGELIGLCVGLHLPYTLVHPTSWKRALLKDMPKDKGASIQRALQLFPSLSLPRKKDHGKAEALLIAYYGATSLGWVDGR